MTVAQLVERLLSVPNQNMEVYIKDNMLNICNIAAEANGEEVVTLNGLEYVFMIKGH